MRKFGVAIFPDERAASSARCVIQELSEQVNAVDASVTVFKHADGSISALDRSGKKSYMAATGAMIGGLSGLPAGPLAVALCAIGGALIGLSAELTNRGVKARFLTSISDELVPGKAAIIADLEEESLPIFENRMKELGGTVIFQD
jgi:uncharacterized membrane protein